MDAASYKYANANIDKFMYDIKYDKSRFSNWATYNSKVINKNIHEFTSSLDIHIIEKTIR